MIFSKKGRVLFAVAVAAAAWGCTTVENARKAQRVVAPKGDDRANAGEAPRVRLRDCSLSSLVAFAMTNRPSVVRARLAVEDARLQLKALAADAPIVSDTPWTALKASASAGYSESSPGATLHRGEWHTRGDPTAGVSVDLLIWDFGRYDAQAKSQAEKVVAAEFGLVDEGYAVFNEVTSAYFTFLEKQSLLDVARLNEREYAAHLSRAEERLKAGEAYRLDILKARLDLANARQSTVTASNMVDTAGATLMNALGIEASRGTWETTFGATMLPPETMRRGFAATDYGVTVAFEIARTNAPAMRQRRAELRASAHAVDYAMADLLPTASLSASLRWTDPLWVWGWGVSAAQTLFQGFRKTTAIDRAVVAMRRAEAEVDAAERSLSVDLETAVANRDNSRAAWHAARASVASARENLKVVQEQLAVGSVSRIELSEAIAANSRAMGSCITAFYDGQRYEAMLFALVGRQPVYTEEDFSAQQP